MSKYINAEELRKAMYNEVFEKDSKLQKWDSGCWIRYKLFVNVLDAMPGTDVVNVIKCKDCKYYDYKETINKIKVRFCSLDIGLGLRFACDDDFCSRGERRETE